MINYEGKRFRAVTDDPGSDAPPAAAGGSPTVGPGVSSCLATYHQDGDLVWAEFAGGEVRRGSLAGTCDPEGTLDFAYCMVLRDGGVISGRSVNTPQVLADGRIRLHERWERYGPHSARGISYMEEVA